MQIVRDRPCPCGSGKRYENCCLNKTNSGYQLHLKGKNAENFVHELAKRSFLEDWCYLNPKLPNGKEICDLLVIYDAFAIIWQIKDLKLDINGKYKESEVQKNLKQISTAKNRLFKLSIPIQIENPRRGKETFNPKSVNKIYAISALLGDDEDCFSFSETIKGQIVHTFNREFTEIALNELDTIEDFIDYLAEKEKLISCDNQIILNGGEKELLAYYLMNLRSFNEIQGVDVLIFDEGSWDELQKKPEHIAKKEEDAISYGWDSIINRAHTSGREYEIIARELARPNRFERRFLSETFFDAHVKAHHETTNNTFRRMLQGKKATYCFLFMDDVEPRNRRKSLLSAICLIARGMNKSTSKVVGIATEMKILPTCSYDFCLVDISDWTEAHQKKMEELQAQTGIFTNINWKYAHKDEYPNPNKEPH